MLIQVLEVRLYAVSSCHSMERHFSLIKMITLCSLRTHFVLLIIYLRVSK